MRKLSIYFVSIVFCMLLLCLQSCTEDTGTFGADMMPMADVMQKGYTEFLIKSKSRLAERVLSRTSTSYLGRFTDPETNSSIKGEFVTQFYTTEVSKAFPDSIKNDSIIGVDVYFYMSGYLGDTLAPLKVGVYKLDKGLDASADYYTDINIQDYVAKGDAPIATSVLTLADNKVPYEDRNTSSISIMRFSLPRQLGQEVYDAYRKDNSVLSNAHNWLNSGLTLSKGLYFKLEGGDGALAYIYNGSLDLNFIYHDQEYDRDTIGAVRLSSTEEVIQATHFENSTNIDSLMTETNCSYVKSPAGLFTELALPIDSIERIACKDTINQASLTLLRLNPDESYNFRIGAPSKLLLVRVGEYQNRFFESYQVADNKTSYLTTFSENSNTYTYNNIARLISTCIEEKKAAEAQGKKIEDVDPDYNKVLLIPVETSYDTSNNLVKLNHDFKVSCAKLVGGTDEAKVKISIIHSKFLSDNQ